MFLKNRRSLKRIKDLDLTLKKEIETMEQEKKEAIEVYFSKPYELVFISILYTKFLKKLWQILLLYCWKTVFIFSYRFFPSLTVTKCLGPNIFHHTLQCFEKAARAQQHSPFLSKVVGIKILHLFWGTAKYREKKKKKKKKKKSRLFF